MSDNDSVNGAWSYQYDPVNRLAQAGCGSAADCDGVPNGNGLSFVYDRFGNMWQMNYVNGGQAGEQSTFTGADNRADGYNYTSDGDVLSVHGDNAAYDAENRLTGISWGTSADYAYFPSGDRAVKTVNGTTSWYLYDDAGHQIAKLNTSGGFERGEIYAGGRHLGSYVLTAGGRTDFTLGDWLGSTRVVLDTQGNVLHVCGDWPYGYNRYCPNGNPSSPMQYTGKPHDNETGLDNFDARMYLSNIGRFMTPDWSATPAAIPYASLANPQSLNLYTYTLDNPVTNIDLFGHVAPKNCTGSSNQNGKGCGKKQSRLKNGLKGGGEAILGIGLMATAAVGDVPGSVAGAMLVASAGIGGASLTVKGTSDIAGAISNTNMRKADKALNATGNLGGLVATVVSGGNLKVGQAAATITSAGALAANPMETTRNAATAIEGIRTSFGVVHLMSRIVRFEIKHLQMPTFF